ncbi:hypothetical protein SAMN05444392_11647 [Seinonella peptonophila]|uniref:Uncharacterized protein n=1 Tax=Seinonella peptonophila TaxID=112248 RepID=A0A1M5AWN1_9BACL|nr:hypothetical protein [Seinonella peptonophila]SHF34681.1 hypothetical protein SAMN05444392_11647 [Seinonella peptonophila]
MRKLPKDQLYQLYIEDFYTYQEIAEFFRCSTETVRKNIEFFNLPKRSKGMSITRRLKMKNQELRRLLNHLYWERGMSTHMIGIISK